MDSQIANWRKVGVTDLISNKELTEVYDPQVLLEASLDHIIVTLRGFVLTAATGEPETIKGLKTVEIEVPATWFDHLVLTYRNRWWMPFKKVNYETIRKAVEFKISVEPRAMFPHAKVKFPQNFGKPVIYYEKTADWI